LYCRLAAAIKAVALLFLVFLGIWLSNLLLDDDLGATQTQALLIAAGIAAVVYYLRAELRLRSYALDLTSDAVLFEYGFKRSYVPIANIQLVDTESTFLLRRFRLSRVNLHTGGGMVVVSPVPTPAAAAIERAIDEQIMTTEPERADART
jgi:membrane protein YdbS with pleckstrin-like domain